MESEHTYSIHLSWYLLEKCYLAITALVSPIPVLCGIPMAPSVQSDVQRNSYCSQGITEFQCVLPAAQPWHFLSFFCK